MGSVQGVAVNGDVAYVADDSMLQVTDVSRCQSCAGDSNGDGAIDLADLLHVSLDWGSDGSAHGGDVDGSGLVDADDLVMLILAWGVCE
jgi:hypothetical protein